MPLLLGSADGELSLCYRQSTALAITGLGMGADNAIFVLKSK